MDRSAAVLSIVNDKRTATFKKYANKSEPYPSSHLTYPEIVSASQRSSFAYIR